MSTRLQAIALTALIVFTGLVYWVEQPFRTPTEPDRARVQKILGRDPGTPVHRFVGPAQTFWMIAKAWVETLGQPISPIIRFTSQGDFWTYRFPADSTYEPPNKPLDCNIDSVIRDAVHLCRYETQRNGQQWTYTLSQTAEEDSAMFVVRISDLDR
jgi:hypothetical protein